MRIEFIRSQEFVWCLIFNNFIKIYPATRPQLLLFIHMMLIDVDLYISAIFKILETSHTLITNDVARFPKPFALKFTFLTNSVSKGVQKHFFICKHLLQIAIFEVRPVFLEVRKSFFGVYHVFLLVYYELSFECSQESISSTNKKLIFERIIDLLSERIHPERALKF